MIMRNDSLDNLYQEFFRNRIKRDRGRKRLKTIKPSDESTCAEFVSTATGEWAILVVMAASRGTGYEMYRSREATRR